MTRLFSLQNGNSRAPSLILLAAIFLIAAPLRVRAEPTCWSDGGSPRFEKTASDVPYQKSADGIDSQKLDIYKPAGRAPPFATVIYIHGGCFKWGAKDSDESREQIRRLTAAGYAVVSVGYRLADSSNPDPRKRNLYPASLEDVQDAVRWVREHGASAPYSLKTDELVAFGQSAGATLAAYLGTRDVKGSARKLDDFAAGYARLSRRVSGVVDFFGRTDFEHHLQNENPSGGNGRDCAEEYLGEPRGAATSADFRRASVLDDVDRKASNFLIVHGSNDTSVVPAHSLELYNSLLATHASLSAEEKKRRFRFELIPGAAHMLNEPHAMDKAWSYVCPFLEDTLVGTRPGTAQSAGANR